MGLKFVILGCGSSGGVPRIGNDWGKCDPNNPLNHRLRCSLLIQRIAHEKEISAGEQQKNSRTSVLIDTSPDMRIQLLRNNISCLDGVFYTHEHADHTNGIDDLRVVSMNIGKCVDVYASESVSNTLKNRFPYCFQESEESGYPRILESHLITPNKVLTINGAGGAMRLLTFEQYHGKIRSVGVRVGNVAYSCDLNGLPDDSLFALRDLDVWVVDALRYKPHSSHFTLDDALGWISRLKPKRAILTNLHIDLDYETLRRSLPDGVEPAYDGMTFETVETDFSSAFSADL